MSPHSPASILARLLALAKQRGDAYPLLLKEPEARLWAMTRDQAIQAGLTDRIQPQK